MGAAVAAAPTSASAPVQMARSPSDSGASPAEGPIANGTALTAGAAAAAVVAEEPPVSAGLPSGRVLLVIIALIAAAIVVFVATK